MRFTSLFGEETVALARHGHRLHLDGHVEEVALEEVFVLLVHRGVDLVEVFGDLGGHVLHVHTAALHALVFRDDLAEGGEVVVQKLAHGGDALRLFAQDVQDLFHAAADSGRLCADGRGAHAHRHDAKLA